MRKKIFYALLLAAMTAAGTVQKARAGGIEDYFSGLKQDVRQTYDEGTWNVMLPLRVWHNRLTYDDEHIDKYNEEPWGLGFGLTRYEGENWHGLYAIAFKDSNDYMQTMFGYAYLINKAIDEEKNWHWGYGYTLGVTQRHEYSYIPVPLPLPIAAVTYKNFSLNATYVPGVKNDGNVLFTWLRIDL